MGQLQGRAWKLQVGELLLPNFDFSFDVAKSLKPEPNQATISIRGLNEEHRSALAGLLSTAKGRAKKQGPGARPIVGVIPVKLEAGYVDPGPDLLFLGDLLTCDHVREGPTWVTNLGAGDGAKAYQKARISQALGPKSNVRDSLLACLQALGLGTGNLAKIDFGSVVLPRGKVLEGSASRRLNELCQSAGIEWSVQEGKVQFLLRGGVMPGQAVLLTPSTGLLGSPTVDQDGVCSASCLLIAGLRCGGVVRIDSAHVKGQFRIENLSAKGDTRSSGWGYEIKSRRYG